MDIQRLNGKQIQFCGETWTIKVLKSMKNGVVGTYNIDKGIITLVNRRGSFDTIMHELFELATDLYKVRFWNSQQELRFTFDHNTLDNIAREVSGAISQLFEIK